MARALRSFQTKDAAVAKLFAKHIKLREAVDMVKNTRFDKPTILSCPLDIRALNLVNQNRCRCRNAYEDN